MCFMSDVEVEVSEGGQEQPQENPGEEIDDINHHMCQKKVFSFVLNNSLICFKRSQILTWKKIMNA